MQSQINKPTNKTGKEAKSLEDDKRVNLESSEHILGRQKNNGGGR